MKPGLKRLMKHKENGTFDSKEFMEDTLAIAAQDPAMADIFARMVKAEIDSIKQKKNSPSPLA